MLVILHTIDRTILESLYTNYSLWKTSFPVVDLTPYVTTTSLTTALGSITKTTDLSASVTPTSLTTTLGVICLSQEELSLGIYPWVLIL